MSITSYVQNGLAKLFGQKVTEPALTFDNILREFDFQIKNRIEQLNQPALDYADQDVRRRRFERSVHLLFDSAELQDTDARHAEFRDDVTGLIDEVYKTYPKVALGIIDNVYDCGWMEVAIAQSHTPLHQTADDIARREVRDQRLEALLDTVREKRKSLALDFAQKSPEGALDYWVGIYDVLEYANIENDRDRRFNEAMLSNRLLHLISVDTIAGLKAIDLESFFEEKPAEVLIASGILAKPYIQNDKVEELARYNKFKALAAQHPMADSLQYLTTIIEPTLHLGHRYPKPAENTPNI